MRLLPLAAAVLAAVLAASIGLPAAAASAASSMMAMKPAVPQSWTVGDLVISGAYARATLPNAPVGGGYFIVVNKGKADDTLVSASSPAAGAVQLHDMAMSNGVMSMRELTAGVPIPAGKTVSFSPDGLHLMLTPLNSRLVKGQTVPVTLTFAKAGAVTIQLSVGGIAAKAPPGAPASGKPDAPGGTGGMQMNGMSM